MRGQMRIAAAALALTAAISATATAQGVELGADIGLGYVSTGGIDAFQIGTPTSLRVGFPVGERAQVEPRTNFALLSGEGETLTTISVMPAIMYQLSGDFTDGPYLAALPVFSIASGFGESTSQFGLGGGIGYRIPKGDHWGFRIEGQFVHSFENDEVAGADRFQALFGVSFRTR